jgi:hypothetical protein
MPRDGAIIFSDLIGKLDVLRVECQKCGRSRVGDAAHVPGEKIAVASDLASACSLARIMARELVEDGESASGSPSLCCATSRLGRLFLAGPQKR